MEFAVLLPFLVLGVVVVALLALATRSVFRGRGAARPAGPVAVPPEEVELEEGPVYACMKCGSPSVGGGGVSMGMIPGAGDAFAYVCRRCRHRGPPLEFADATAYRLFVQGLNEESGGQR